MNWEFIYAMFYGVILGVLGNLMVDLFMQRFYPHGMSKRVAEVGLLATLAVILIGFAAVLYVSSSL